MFEDVTKYPLTWPFGWKRTPAGKREYATFFGFTENRIRRDHTMAEAVEFVLAELDLLYARTVVISSNVEVKKDGLPRSTRSTVSDPGVAVYFSVKGDPRVLACDKWTRPEDNLWAIGKHINALRGMDRWGVGTVEQAFAGYPVLPAPGAEKPWWEVLGVLKTASMEEIQAAYRAKAKQYHPDTGGNQEEFLKIQQAFDAARKDKKA